MWLRRGIMRNLGTFPLSHSQLIPFTLLLVALFFTCPFASLLLRLPSFLFSILHWATYMLGTSSNVQLASPSSILRPATLMYMATMPILCLVDEYIKNILDAMLYLVLFKCAFHGFLSSFFGLPCTLQTNKFFSDPGS